MSTSTSVLGWSALTSSPLIWNATSNAILYGPNQKPLRHLTSPQRQSRDKQIHWTLTRRKSESKSPINGAGKKCVSIQKRNDVNVFALIGKIECIRYVTKFFHVAYVALKNPDLEHGFRDAALSRLRPLTQSNSQPRMSWIWFCPIYSQIVLQKVYQNESNA